MSNKIHYMASIAFIGLFNVFLLAGNVLAVKEPEKDLKQAGISTVLGTQLDLNINLQTADGRIDSLFSILSDGKPLILVPVYYRCPRLCGLTLGGVTQLVKELELKAGADYKIASFSFNPQETPEEASKKKQHYLKLLAEDNKLTDGWEFYLGKAEDTSLLIKQLGFGVVADGEDYAHSAAIFIINPAGQISQFFSNIDFDSRDVRLALVEAAQGKIGNIVDQAMLFCFKFDPEKGQYTWAVSRLLKVTGALTLILLGGLIGYQLYKERFSGRT